MVQVSHLADSYLHNHNHPAQITHVKILTTQTWTTVYHKKSTGGCQNKMTGMQMSPRDPRPTGTTTTTQTSSQAGGTQTTPPPSPKKTTLTGGTQTSPPKNNSCKQVGQGQLDHNWDKWYDTSLYLALILCCNFSRSLMYSQMNQRQV